MDEVRASQLAQASERVGSLIPASYQLFNPVVKLVLENQPFLINVDIYKGVVGQIQLKYLATLSECILHGSMHTLRHLLSG